MFEDRTMPISDAEIKTASEADSDPESFNYGAEYIIFDFPLPNWATARQRVKMATNPTLAQILKTAEAILDGPDEEQYEAMNRGVAWALTLNATRKKNRLMPNNL